MKKAYVTVIGSSSKISEEVYEKAVKVGKLLAKNGVIVITGGRTGVMEAVCKGVKDEGGITVGILPGFTRDEANKYVDIAIPTGLGYARNALNVLAGDVVIAIAGGPGTLSEIGLALAYEKPVIILKGTGGFSDLLAEAEIGKYNIEVAETPEEAVEKAMKIIRTK
ncbi:MAG: TIGR00725 family protein [archaeon GB-1867-005]|nr:TIGR00725 family protein [Candidatus Culexmicrobium cathedralense]